MENLETQRLIIRELEIKDAMRLSEYRDKRADRRHDNRHRWQLLFRSPEPKYCIGILLHRI